MGIMDGWDSSLMKRAEWIVRVSVCRDTLHYFSFGFTHSGSVGIAYPCSYCDTPPSQLRMEKGKGYGVMVERADILHEALSRNSSMCEL